MHYAIQKMIGDEDYVRYALVQKGHNTLYVIGLNPSTANECKPDPTLRKLMGYADRNGFDGLVVLNLYPERATKPDSLPAQADSHYYEENLRVIDQLLSEEPRAPKILACFGEFVHQRPYLSQSRNAIVDIARKYNAEWLCIGLNKSGTPKHPIRSAYCCFQKYSVMCK